VVDAHRVVGGDGPVDEAEARPSPVLLAQTLEDPLDLPPGEHVQLQRRMVGLLAERHEGLGHALDSRGAGFPAVRPRNRNGRRPVYRSMLTETERNEMPQAVTETTFQNEVLNSETPVIVDFWAEWCGPCHAVAPVLDRIVEEHEGELKLVKVNIDEEQELARRYGIMSIPTIILFKEGEPAQVAVGAQPKNALERALGLAA
jgi:thioredoxin